MTARSDDADTARTKAAADVAANRHCLRCNAAFWSEGFGERICARCKGTVAWRSAVSGSGTPGHRRSGRRMS